jgi:hypothetical protein
VLLALTGLAAAGCGSSPPPTVSIDSPANGSHVAGNVASLHLVATGISIVTANGDTSGNTGHYALFVDIPPVAAGAPVTPSAGVIPSTNAQITVAGLVVGRHTFTAVLADGADKRLGSAQASVQVTVNGPAVTAGVVGQVTAGQPFSLQLSTYGVTIANIPADTSGHTAHYAVSIDGPMPHPGVVVPPGAGVIITTGSRVPMPVLSKGTHVIWVVLVDGAGKTLTPLSAASVMVNVPA